MNRELVTWLHTQQGNAKAGHQGFYYVKQKESADKRTTFWHCDGRKTRYCKARMKTVGDHVVEVSGEHSHTPDGPKAQVNRALHDIRTAAENTPAPTAAILQANTNGMDVAASVALPNDRAMKKMVQRRREEAQHLPAQPRTRGEIVIPVGYSTLPDGREFLISDLGEGDERILIFATQRNLEHLSRILEVYSDGTFSSAPPLFSQLYTVHGILHHHVRPLVFALLPRKDRGTYLRLFRELRRLCPGWHPQQWMSDFESAAVGAIQEVFPGVECTGCLFHFCQCTYRKIVELGFQARYREEDGAFATWVRAVCALSFVPVDDVEECFETLVAHPDFPADELEPFLAYFEDVWVGRPRHRGPRRPPLFPHAMWNVRVRTLAGQHRTNNNVEGWNRRFSSTLACSNPSIFKFIRALASEQLHQVPNHLFTWIEERMMENAEAGDMPYRKRAYQQADMRLRNIALDFGEPDRPLVPYLRAISHNLKV